MATTLASVFGEWVQSGLLTRQTELELGRIVQSGLAAEKQLQSLAQEPPQSDPQEPPSQDLDSNSAAAASLETLEVIFCTLNCISTQEDWQYQAHKATFMIKIPGLVSIAKGTASNIPLL